ncbi:MAG: hypothetical protein ACI4HK_06465 [Ruminococcus sp.]
MTVNTLAEEHKTYHTDYIRFHLHFSDSKYPPIGFIGSSMRGRSYSTLMIWN